MIALPTFQNSSLFKDRAMSGVTVPRKWDHSQVAEALRAQESHRLSETCRGCSWCRKQPGDSGWVVGKQERCSLSPGPWLPRQPRPLSQLCPPSLLPVWAHLGPRAGQLLNEWLLGGQFKPGAMCFCSGESPEETLLEGLILQSFPLLDSDVLCTDGGRGQEGWKGLFSWPGRWLKSPLGPIECVEKVDGVVVQVHLLYDTTWVTGDKPTGQ